MDYITAKAAAQKWNAPLRTVQQFCADGKIKDAVKIGTQWMIPKEAENPGKRKKKEIKEHIYKEHSITDFGYSIPMPLLNIPFDLGEAKETAENIKDKDLRNIALAEYYYFSGNSKKAAEITEDYLKSEDLGHLLSAAWIYAYASLALDNIKGTREAMTSLKKALGSMNENTPKEIKALIMFVNTASSVLLHLPLEYEIPPMGEFIGTLPSGLRLFALYIYAHYAYLQKAYAASAGIAETALALESKIYPIPTIYLHLIAVMDYVSLKKPDYAVKHMTAAWEIAKKDSLFGPLGEHHGLLCGMIEAAIKRESPEDFKKIIGITYKFSAGWRKIHNYDTGNSVAETLSTTEFAVAMLATKDYSNKEIASVLGISENTVKAHIGHAMNEFGLSDRRELAKYMLL